MGSMGECQVIGSWSPVDEAVDAVFAWIAAGHVRGPRHTRDRGVDRSHLAQAGLSRQGGQIGHHTLIHHALHQAVRHAVNAQDNHFLGWIIPL